LGTDPETVVQGGCTFELQPTMKAKLASHFRHLLTGAASLGTFLGTHALIDAADVSQVNTEAAQAAPLIASIAATVATRVALSLVAKYAPSLFRLFGRSGNAGALLLMCTAAAFLTLSSCASMTAPDGTVTRKPDSMTISQVSRSLLDLVTLFAPPRATPVPTPPAVDADGK